MSLDERRDVERRDVAVADHNAPVNDRMLPPRRVAEEQRCKRVMQCAGRADLVEGERYDVCRHRRRESADVVAAKHSGATARRDLERLARRHGPERQRMVSNILRAARAATLYGLRGVHSTVNVATGINKPAIKALRTLLEQVPTYERTSINAWEDLDFRKAVQATGHKKLVMAAPWRRRASHSQRLMLCGRGTRCTRSPMLSVARP